MKIPPVRVIVTAVSKAANSSLMETPKYLNTIKEEIVYKKINDINKWYTKIIGLDEVKLYQDRVFDLQQRLLYAQEKRREVGSILTDIRKKSNELQDQIHKVKRQDDLQRFLDLMKDETDVLKQEIEVTEAFTNCDREEREIFSAFTNAIRDSHEKQRAQLEYTKYFGLILSIAGSFLAFTYSSIRKNDLKRYIEQHYKETSVDPTDIATIVSTPFMKSMEENRKRNDAIIETIMHNHRQLIHAVNKQKIPVQDVKLKPVVDLNEMPDGEKLLWFSVLSLLGLMLLKKLFN